MSCSKWLQNKKGPQATVWVAAFGRVETLTRDQVASTDIVASVDKILQDAQAPQRILALLLLGLVKIYSKKAQYLYDDCNIFFRSLEPRRNAEPSTSTRRSVGVKAAVQAGHLKLKETTRVEKSIHTMRITKICGSISSEGLPVRTETEINVQTSVVVREASVSVALPLFTIPERFELDSFDLGIADDLDDDDEEEHHQLGRQDISLEDERLHAQFLYERTVSSYSIDPCCLMPEYIALPPEASDAISEVNNFLDLSIKGHEPERKNPNADSVWFTPVKDVLPPETVEIMAERKGPSIKSKTGDESVGKVNMDGDAGSTCSILLPESQERQIPENVLENMTFASPSANYPTVEVPENGLFLEKSNTGPHVGGFHDHEAVENELLGKSNTGPPVGGFEEHVAEEHESPEAPVLRCKTQALNHLSPSSPLPEGITGPPLSSTFVVRTPLARNERRQSTKSRKRKYYNREDYLPTEREEKRQRIRLMFPVLDEVIILSNDMMRKAIGDASDLVRTRKKVPHTHLGAWKVAKIGSLPDSFMDPLIPYQTSVNLANLTTPKAPVTSYGESVKARRRLSYKVSESSHSCNGATERESFDEPRERKLGGPTVATPVGRCTESGHLQHDVRGCSDDTNKEKDTKVKGDEPTSLIQSDKGLHEPENHTSLYNETGHLQADVRGCNDDTNKEMDTQVEGDEPTSLIQSDKGLHEPENHTSLYNEAFHGAPCDIDEDTPMNGEQTVRDGGLPSSGRTRKVARLLHQLFKDQNSNQGTNSVNLSHVLEGKERRTSALFFYETLILKSRGLIEVNQEKPFDDIKLSPTPQFEAALQGPCGGTTS